MKLTSSRTISRCVAAVLGVFLTGAVGCSSMNLSKSMPFFGDKTDVPTSIVAIWSESVLHEPNQPPMRGFAGRLVFYTENGAKPIKVDGSLSIYAFDEEGRDASDVKPDRKYVFTAEQLEQRCTKEKIGPGYTVWLPWDEVGGPKQEISLIVRFVPKGGRLVVGEPTRQVLTGPMLDEPKSAVAKQQPPAGANYSGVQQVAYEAAASNAAGPLAPITRPVTTTIPLPSNFGRGSIAPNRAPASLPGRDNASANHALQGQAAGNAAYGNNAPYANAPYGNAAYGNASYGPASYGNAAPAGNVAPPTGAYAIGPNVPMGTAPINAPVVNPPSTAETTGQAALWNAPHRPNQQPGAMFPPRTAAGLQTTSPSRENRHWAQRPHWPQASPFSSQQGRAPGSQMLQPSARFPLDRSPAPSGPVAPPEVGRAPSQQPLEGSPYLPPTPPEDPAGRGLSSTFGHGLPRQG